MIKKVTDWVESTYGIDQDDAMYLAELLIDDRFTDLFEALDVDNDIQSAMLSASKLRDAYQAQFSPVEPVARKVTRPQVISRGANNVPRPIKPVEPEITDVVIEASIGGKPVTEPDVIEECHTVAELPEVAGIDIQAPKKIGGMDVPPLPKRSPSQGLGKTQFELIDKLLDSVEYDDVTGEMKFDPYDPKSGGMLLNDGPRSCFMTLLARGGICEVKDSILYTNKGNLKWGRKVIPCLPFAKEVWDDYADRHIIID